MFWLICSSAFFRCFMLNSGAFKKPQTELLSMEVKVKVKLASLVEGDLKASFSIATTPRVEEGATFFLDCSTLPLMLTL